MKNFYTITKKHTLAIILLLVAVFTSVNLQAQTSITANGISYTQDFNSLTSAGTWTDNSTLSGWYATGPASTPLTSFVINDGESGFDELTSFGTVASSDRAIGFAPSTLLIGGYYCVGWRFKNNTGSTISSLEVKWTGEQWRDESSTEQNINLNYLISASPITGIDDTSLDEVFGGQFISPINTGNGTKLNGNAGANRSLYTHVITSPIPNGSEIIIVWKFTDLGVNHLMAIDDISVTAKIPQTITFSPTGAISKTYGDSNFSLNASASSGLAITYTSSNTTVATVSGSTVQILGPGTTNITANQAGNSLYLGATSVSKTLNVYPKIPTVNPADNITTTSFRANWSIDNGSRDGSTSYVIQYANNKSFTSPTTRSTSSGVKLYSISGLNPNTIYFYKIYAINSSLPSSFSQSSAITTGTDYITVNSGNWDTGSNWDVGNINNVANSIKIQHAITLNTARDSVTTNTLWITSTGKLTTNQKIHVTNQLIIEVDANGVSGQILNTNNINIGYNAKIIVRRSFTAGRWNFVGFPFEVTAANIFAGSTSTQLTWGDLGGSGDFNVVEYDGAKRNATGAINTSGAGLNWVNVTGRKFVAKKGYNLHCASSRIIDFTLRGENKTDIFSITGSSANLGQYTSNSFAGHHSWNLITLPYISSYDMALSTTNAPYYVYNGVNYNTSMAGETLEVYPFLSFFLQASASTISFASTGKRVKAPAKIDNANLDEIYLKLSNGNTTYDDLTRIRIQEGASVNYVVGQDAAKVFGMDPNVSYIYSYMNNSGFAVNTVPPTVTSIDLQTKFAAAGNYNISINNIEKINNYSAVTLIDKLENKSIDLLTTGTYNFTTSVANTTNRFKVVLSPKLTTGITTIPASEIRIISNYKKVNIIGIDENTGLKIYDLTGKTIYNGQISEGEFVEVPEKGLYLFEISTQSNTTKIKTYIN